MTAIFIALALMLGFAVGLVAGKWGYGERSQMSNVGWISVKDQLPDETTLVLVCFEDGSRLLGRRDEWGGWETEEEEALIGVAYWTAIPEPPATRTPQADS